MGPFERKRPYQWGQHGQPLLGRVRAPARSPTSQLVCSPPTPSFPSASAPVVPCLRPTSLRALLLCRHRRPAARATREHAARRRWVIGSPWAGLFTRRNEGLPGFWAVLFVRAAVEDPAGCDPLLAHDAEAAEAFRRSNTLGTRNGIAFVAAWPAAHTLVYLRIAAPVTGHAARLTTGLGGLTPDRAGFAPAGRRTGFHEVIAFFNPPRPACLVASGPLILSPSQFRSSPSRLNRRPRSASFSG
jgi:hypothetical protein